MDMLSFCDKLHVLVLLDSILVQYGFKSRKVLPVDDEQFVLIELNFQGNGWV